MKSIKQLSYIGLLIMFILTSCTMEKRVYMSGYHIDWKKGKNNKQALVNNDNEKKSEENKIVPVVKLEKEVNIVDNSNTTVTEDNFIASADNQQIITSEKKKNIFLTNPKINIQNEDNQNKPTFKSEFKKGTKMILAPSDDPKTNGSALAGFILSLVGLFIFGFILGVLAIIFSAIGLGKIKKDPAKWKGKGMAIAGLIIGIVDIIGWLIVIALIL